jgi:hypothetical protein
VKRQLDLAEDILKAVLGLWLHAQISQMPRPFFGLINFGHLTPIAPAIRKAMLTRTASWPIEALPFEDILNPIVESFLDPEKGRAFDWSRSAIRQLYDRVDELAAPPHKNVLLALIRDQLGEFDCLAICNSGIRDPQLLPANAVWHSESTANNPPVQ